MIQIQISDKMRDLARKYESEVLKNLKLVPNYTCLESDGRYYYGYLGEFVFLKHCKNENVKCKYKIITDGNSDNEDFIIYYSDGKEIRIDIKTASKGFHKNIMLPKKQIEKYNYNYYIGVRIGDNNDAYIHGFCEAKDFLFNENGFDNAKVPTCYKALNELTNIGDLLKNTSKGRIETNLK